MLRVSSAYRTATEAAVIVISVTVPIHLQVEEKRSIYLNKVALGKKEAGKMAR